MQRTSRDALIVNILSIVIALGIVGCEYPKDMNDSLNRPGYRGGVLNVSVTENLPWVIRRENDAYGVEPAGGDRGPSGPSPLFDFNGQI